MTQGSMGLPPAAAAISGPSGVVLEAVVGSPASSKTLPKVDVLSTSDDVLTISSAPSVDQKLFLVVSVALATVCFFTNIVQVGVFLRPSALRSVKSLLLLSQALSGIFASFVVAFPIHVISARGGSVVGESGYNACYLGHSGIILVTLFTSLSTATLLLFHYYLTNNHPRKYMAVGNSVIGWGGAIVGVWASAFGIALLPWAGWNSWANHDARCHLSTLWPLSFTAFLTFLVGAHMAATLFMWASTRAAHLKVAEARMAGRAARSPGCGVNESEAVPITPIIVHGGLDRRVSVCGWGITVSSLLPLVGHVVVSSSCAASTICLSSPHHYHEEAAALPWASLLLTAAGIANPLLYVFSDDQVSSTTLLLLSRVCCWWRRGRQERLVPQPEANDEETNVYVTNDTEHLVGDNT